MRKIVQLWLAFALSCLTFLAVAADSKTVRLATATSTANSGLLDYLLPRFEARCGCKVRVIAVGTGKALKLAEDGNVDVVLTHARKAEDAFLKAGHGVDRRDVMYNDFVLIGPDADPARIRGLTSALAAMKSIADTKSKCVSRGDDSGTDQMERALWKELGISPAGESWYLSAGQGMGEVLMMSAALRAYALTDRGTYLAYQEKIGLPILMQGDPRLYNPYGMIAVNPKKYPDINYAGAKSLIEWMTSEQGQKLIADFKINGHQVFSPNAR